MNDDFEERIAAALNAHVDHELGERRPAPAFEPPARRAARPRPRRAPWMLPLVAAASVVAVVAGSVGASQLLADDGPAAHPSPVVSGSRTPSPSTSAVPTSVPPSTATRTSVSLGTPQVSHPHRQSHSHSSASTVSSPPPPPTPTVATLGGAQIWLPAGWRATRSAGERAWCLDAATAPSGSCAVRFERIASLRPGDYFDVDKIGLGRGTQVELCTNHPRERTDVREFGGRPAEYRQIRTDCGQTFTQYVVATNPIYALSGTSSEVVGTMASIAGRSTLPGQTDPLRVFDRGYLRSYVSTPEGEKVTIDRVLEKYSDNVGGSFVDDRSSQTYTYLVPNRLWHDPSDPGRVYFLLTTGRAVYRIQPDSTWM